MSTRGHELSICGTGASPLRPSHTERQYPTSELAQTPPHTAQSYPKPTLWYILKDFGSSHWRMYCCTSLSLDREVPRKGGARLTSDWKLGSGKAPATSSLICKSSILGPVSSRPSGPAVEKGGCSMHVQCLQARLTDTPPVRAWRFQMPLTQHGDTCAARLYAALHATARGFAASDCPLGLAWPHDCR